ncbi:MAG: hypothetical protein PHW69_03510 [Elusimicrobiaceae bacterium]|nr:hypothetical protein [Elusimicrobiaceae bacterium]
MAKILVVDNDVTAITELGQWLPTVGHAAMTAQDADGAVKEFRASRPDLILAELEIAGGGAALINRLRREKGAATPALLMSKLPREQAGPVLKLYKVYYIGRPFSAQELLAAINTALGVPFQAAPVPAAEQTPESAPVAGVQAAPVEEGNEYVEFDLAQMQVLAAEKARAQPQKQPEQDLMAVLDIDIERNPSNTPVPAPGKEPEAAGPQGKPEPAARTMVPLATNLADFPELKIEGSSGEVSEAGGSAAGEAGAAPAGHETGPQQALTEAPPAAVDLRLTQAPVLKPVSQELSPGAVENVRPDEAAPSAALPGQAQADLAERKPDAGAVSSGENSAVRPAPEAGGAGEKGAGERQHSVFDVPPVITPVKIEPADSAPAAGPEAGGGQAVSQGSARTAATGEEPGMTGQDGAAAGGVPDEKIAGGSSGSTERTQSPEPARISRADSGGTESSRREVAQRDPAAPVPAAESAVSAPELAAPLPSLPELVLPQQPAAAEKSVEKTQRAERILPQVEPRESARQARLTGTDPGSAIPAGTATSRSVLLGLISTNPSLKITEPAQLVPGNVFVQHQAVRITATGLDPAGQDGSAAPTVKGEVVASGGANVAAQAAPANQQAEQLLPVSFSAFGTPTVKPASAAEPAALPESKAEPVAIMRPRPVAPGEFPVPIEELSAAVSEEKITFKSFWDEDETSIWVGPR